MECFRPQNQDEIADIIASSVVHEAAIEVVGAGSKRALGDAVTAQNSLDLRHLSGILSYQPQELVLETRAATSMAEINAVLAEKKQILAFEPPDYGALLATSGGTIGGVLLSNLSGSRRPFAGGGRDFLLGFTAVSGRAEIFKAGGKVVKNVTGFDLSKLIVGSYGTLCIATSLNLKTHPVPQCEQSLLLACEDIASAETHLRQAINGVFTPTAAAYLPANIGKSLNLPISTGGIILRFEGTPSGVRQAITQLQNTLTSSSISEQEQSRRLWQDINNASTFAANKQTQDYRLWRISVPPATWVQHITNCQEILTNFQYFVNWGGGLIWLKENLSEPAGQHQKIRKITEKLGGHAQKITERITEKTTTPDQQTTPIASFHPRPEAELRLLQRIKKGFDPKNILNPKRMGF